MPEGNRPATREPALDMAKGIAVIGVVLIHTHTWLGAIGVRSAALDVIAGRLTIPLPEFFFVSGVVVASSVVGRDATSRSLWHRLRPILWLYVIWQPLVFAYRIVGDAFVRQEPVDWSGELIRLLAFPLRPNGELWYLWALALLLTLSYLTRNISSRVVIPIAALCFVAVYSFGELASVPSGGTSSGRVSSRSFRMRSSRSSVSGTEPCCCARSTASGGGMLPSSWRAGRDTPRSWRRLRMGSGTRESPYR